MAQRQPIAVLTGDLVGSSDATPKRISETMALLQDYTEEIAAHSSPNVTPRFTRFRGDGWQCYFDAPSFAPRIALAITAKLRGVETALETRIAIGIGTWTSLGSGDLSDASGDAFERSGKALDTMTKLSRLTIAGALTTPTDQIALTLLSERSSKWSQEQAEAMAEALLPSAPTQATIAKRLGISPQAVSYRLSGAGASAIRKALDLWEDDLMNRLYPIEGSHHV